MSEFQQTIEQYNQLKSRDEVDSMIFDLIGKGWANIRYNLGVLLIARLRFTVESEKQQFLNRISREFDIKQTVISQCKTVAATYSATEWEHYVVKSGLTFSHMYYAASKIKDPEQRARLLQQAIDENMTATAFRAMLNEIAPSDDDSESSGPVRFLRLRGVLELREGPEGRNDLVIRTPEDEQSLSMLFQSFIGKEMDINIRYKE